MQPLSQDSTTALLRAISGSIAARGVRFALEEISSRFWASATFTGARHELAFRVEGDGAQAASDSFLSDLGAAEFDLRGHILADIALVSRERSPGETRIRLEALTVEDS